jgi:hypothetical protein
MKILQYYLACLSHASYMITDEKTKTAAVVDPQRDIELRDRAGATIHLGRRAQADTVHT